MGRGQSVITKACVKLPLHLRRCAAHECTVAGRIIIFAAASMQQGVLLFYDFKVKAKYEQN
jgi:hypothetical protein